MIGRQPVELPFDLTEIPYRHDPSNAYDVTWNGTGDQRITMHVEGNHGLDVIGAALTSPVDAVDIGGNRLFWTVDPTDPKVAQIGIAIDEHVVNIEAYDVSREEMIAMAVSIADASIADWTTRVPNATI